MVKQQIVSLATDFSGLDFAALALERSTTATFVHIWSCEKKENLVKLVWQSSRFRKPKVNFPDATKRRTKEMPYADLFVSTPECQDYSPDGKQNGQKNGYRGLLIKHSVRFILAKKPRAFLFEQSDQLFSKRHFPVLKKVMRICAKRGRYNVRAKKINSLDQTGCQYRCRTYIAGIRKIDGITSRPFKWPAKSTIRPKASQFINPPTDHDAPSLPPARPHKSPKEHNRSRQLAKSYVARWKARGANPKTSLVIGDTGCSKNRGSSRHEESPALTCRRCRGHDLWLSTHGRTADTNEMFKLQTHLEDLDDEFPNWQQTVSKGQMGNAIGNSLHIPTVARILKNLLSAANIQDVQLKTEVPGF